MKTNTTLFLALALAGLVVWYLAVGSKPAVEPDASAPTAPRMQASSASRELTEKPLGDVVKVTCERKGHDEPWVFEKDATSDATGRSAWRMTAPTEMKCMSWELDKYASRLGGLSYELSYKPGDAGAVTADRAGLAPPEATITMTDAEGESVTIDIGRPASSTTTYVRVGDSDEICVGSGNLKDLLKDSPLDYRDKQLWRFEKDRAVRIEIDDRSDAASPQAYVFVRDGARWMMAEPVTARVTSKVDELVTGIMRLNVVKWLDDDAGKLGVYALREPALSVRVTVEELVPAEDAGSDEEPAPEPGTRQVVHELHVSARSPLGEDTKVYVRAGVENAVGTIFKSAADKFKPVMAEWRDMHLTTADVAAATRVELVTPDGPMTIAKEQGAWRFEPDGGLAEASVVTDLLSAVGDLSAVVFVDDGADDAAAGLDAPRAEIRLMIPGTEGVEHLVIGDYTDPATRRLAYARRNEQAIAKVRDADLAKLLQGPTIYRDRTIVEELPSRFASITLSSRNPFDDGPSEITLARDGTAWEMVAPVEAPVQQEKIDKLIETLGGLRAERVAAGEAEASAFGLHAPAASVTVRLTPFGTADDETADDTITLAVAAHEGKHYARRTDRPTVYEMTGELLTLVTAEYRDDRVLLFDEGDVRQFSIRHDEVAHTFELVDDRWRLQAEPDLPLDDAKVKNLLLQIRDLRTPRYVRHTSAEPGSFGLTAPKHEVSVVLEGGQRLVLQVSAAIGSGDSDSGHYAAVAGRTEVFLLTPASIARFAVSLDELEAGR